MAKAFVFSLTLSQGMAKESTLPQSLPEVNKDPNNCRTFSGLTSGERSFPLSKPARVGREELGQMKNLWNWPLNACVNVEKLNSRNQTVKLRPRAHQVLSLSVRSSKCTLRSVVTERGSRKPLGELWAQCQASLMAEDRKSLGFQKIEWCARQLPTDALCLCLALCSPG